MKLLQRQNITFNMIQQKQNMIEMKGIKDTINNNIN